MEDITGSRQQYLCHCEKYAAAADTLESAFSGAGIFPEISFLLQEGNGNDICKGIKGWLHKIFCQFQASQDGPGKTGKLFRYTVAALSQYP